MKFIRIFFRLSYLLFVIISGVFFAAIFLRNTMSPSGFAASLTRNWHRHVCRAFNIKIEITGTPPTTASLIVANHISWFDISALGSVLAARYLSKYEVVTWPVVGWLAKKAGTLFIQRGANKATHSMGKMTDALKEGSYVILFPEGTTTDGSSVRKFHARLFQSAIDSQVPVQPVIISYPHDGGVHPKAPFIDDITLYESAAGMLSEPHMKVTLDFLAPVTVENKTRDELASECEQMIRSKIEKAFL